MLQRLDFSGNARKVRDPRHHPVSDHRAILYDVVLSTRLFERKKRRLRF